MKPIIVLVAALFATSAYAEEPCDDVISQILKYNAIYSGGSLGRRSHDFIPMTDEELRVAEIKLCEWEMAQPVPPPTTVTPVEYGWMLQGEYGTLFFPYDNTGKTAVGLTDGVHWVGTTHELHTFRSIGCRTVAAARP